MFSVLIVDDNHSFIDSLKVLLKEISYIQATKSVANFRLAEAELKKQHFHLIIIENDTEVSMKGLDFIRNIRKASDAYNSNNFILLSSRLGEIADRAKSDGIRAFKKPIQTIEFKEYILRLFESRLILPEERDENASKE